jgi:hypothetical protein
MTVSSDPVAPQPQWSPEVRTWVSLLLFAHLFAVFVAVTTYTRPSIVQERLHELFAPYLRNLHLTAYPVSYPFARYHLTHALPADVDFTCQVEFEGPDGSAETISIPGSAMQPLVRFRRYQSLANATGALAESETNEEFNGILPRAIAGSILKTRGVKQATFRCRSHELPEMEALGDAEPARRAALENYRDVYEAQVFVTPGGVEVLKKATTLEVAPVKGGTKSPSKPQP